MKTYKILHYERLNNSVNGNPRYSLILQDQETHDTISCKTKSDYAYNYGMFNKGYDFLTCELTYTKAGNCYIDKVEY